MKVSVEQFWDLLASSQLLSSGELDLIRRKNGGVDGVAKTSQSVQEIAKMLVKSRKITRLQSKVLQAGLAGPFHFGRYCLTGLSPVEDVFQATDVRTGLSVWLHFCRGESPEDLLRWDQVESCSDAMAKLSRPCLSRIYESVVTPDYRYVVTAKPRGKRLSDKLPGIAKLPLEQAVWVGLKICRVVTALDSEGIGTPEHLIESIWLAKKDAEKKTEQSVSLWVSPLQLHALSSRHNDRNLACLLWKLMTGRVAQDLEECRQLGVEGLSSFLHSKVKEDVPQSLCLATCKLLVGEGSVMDLTSALEDMAADQEMQLGDDRVSRSYAAAEEAFVHSLNPWQEETSTVDEAVPELAPPSDSATPLADELRRGSPKQKKSTVLFASLMGLAALIGLAAWATLPAPPSDRVPDSDREPKLVASNDAGEKPDVDVQPETNTDAESAAGSTAVEPAVESGRYQQQLVADDATTLWESPTTGFPLETHWMPTAPRMIAAVRWQALREDPSARFALRSLGPDFERLLAGMEKTIGFSRDTWQRSVISWHSNDRFQYDWCAHVTLASPVNPSDWLNAQGSPTPVADVPDVYESKSATGYWVTEKSDEGVRSFLVGPIFRVRGAAKGETAVLNGTMWRLLQQSDSNRDFTFITSTPALFNSEAQDGTGAAMGPLMRELRRQIPGPVLGFLVSLHFDQGDYFEIRVDHSADSSSREMVDVARKRLGEDLVQSIEKFDGMTAVGFWEPVRSRMSAMVRDFSKNLRWGSEFKEVIGNAWLRPGALHNLLAVTELAVAFPATDRSSVAKTTQTPQTFEELLGAKRDLSVANPPDLNVLLKEISAGISDQYLDLPFKFNIQIAGSDLQKEGITQNQRPSALDMRDQSLADILTKVMVAANPNRNISGPADPECKLVWVVVDDESNPGQKLVLITTRAAAAEKGYTLPTSFNQP